MSQRNECSEEKCPETLLEDMEPTSLNKWLSTFLAETRKVNGEPYPPTTLHLLLSGLKRHMRAMDKERAPNIFAKNNPVLQKLHHTMDSVYRKLRSDGIGTWKNALRHSQRRKRTNFGNLVYLVLTAPQVCCVQYFSAMEKTFTCEVAMNTGTCDYCS